MPALRGEGGDAYAVTEAEAGSDPGGISATAASTGLSSSTTKLLSGSPSSAASDSRWRDFGCQSIRRAANRIRVTAQLINIADGYIIVAVPEDDEGNDHVE